MFRVASAGGATPSRDAFGCSCEPMVTIKSAALRALRHKPFGRDRVAEYSVESGPALWCAPTRLVEEERIAFLAKSLNFAKVKEGSEALSERLPPDWYKSSKRDLVQVRAIVSVRSNDLLKQGRGLGYTLRQRQDSSSILCITD